MEVLWIFHNMDTYMYMCICNMSERESSLTYILRISAKLGRNFLKVRIYMDYSQKI